MNAKKKLGQFFTDPLIARFMASLVIDDTTSTVLDPAVGPGILLKSAYDIKPSLRFFAYDLDPNMITLYRKNNDFKTHLVNSDYLTSNVDLKYDAIICNPPYNKFQQIDNRHQILDQFRTEFGVRMSGYSNYCVYFLIKSLNELRDQGKCCYIMPYEFLNASYGQAIKKYMLSCGKLKSIIKFNNNLKLFSDAITTSCIVVCENKPHSTVDFVNVNDISEIKDFKGEFTVNNVVTRYYSELDDKLKWINYFNRDSEVASYSHNIVPFSKVARVKRGIATGNNNYFSLSQSKIQSLRLSEDVCLRCATRSPDIKSAIFSEDEFNKLRNADKKVFIFDGSKAKTKEDFSYIKYGESMEYNKTYLTSHRTPWYSIEDKDIAPIWLSVFSRHKLKVVRNQCMIRNLTTFHGVYCTDDYSNYTDILFCYLLTPSAQSLLRQNKREYGEGLNKFEPNDINNAKILDLKCLNDHEISDITNIYNNMTSSDFESSISSLEKIFAKHISVGPI